MGKIASVQMVRAAAAIAVVANHVCSDAPVGGGIRWLFQIYPLAEIGVHVFFAISGMLMILTLREGGSKRHRSGDFLLRRVERIYPTYLFWLAMLLLTAVAARMAGTGYLDFVLRDAVPSLLIKNILLMPGLPDETHYRMLIPQAWTLVYEMYFYLVFALCLAIVPPRRLLLALIVAIALPLVVARLFFPTPDRLGWVNLAYMVADPLILMFLMGAAFGAWWKAGTTIRIVAPGSLPHAAIMVVALVVAVVVSGHDMAEVLVRMLAAMALLVAAAYYPVKEGPVARWGEFFGAASYSIYLAHVMLTYMSYKPHRILPLPAWTIDTALTVLAVALGCLSYRWFEQPVQSAFTQIRRRRRARLAHHVLSD